MRHRTPTIILLLFFWCSPSIGQIELDSTVLIERLSTIEDELIKSLGIKHIDYLRITKEVDAKIPPWARNIMFYKTMNYSLYQSNSLRKFKQKLLENYPAKRYTRWLNKKHLNTIYESRHLIEFYDAFPKDSLLSEATPYFKESAEMLGIASNMRIAEIGVGHGAFALFLSQTFNNLDMALNEIDSIKLEFTEGLLSFCNLDQSSIKIDYRLGTANNPNLEGEFDLIFMINVYHHLREPEELLSKINKHLTKEGKLIIVESIKNNSKHCCKRKMDHEELLDSFKTNKVKVLGTESQKNTYYFSVSPRK